MKTIMLLPFIFGSSCSTGNQWMALIMDEKKGIFLFLILQVNMEFLTSPTGERLHGLRNYHNGKTALFYCIFLGPFRPHVYGATGKQINLPFPVFVFEHGHWCILGEMVEQQVLLSNAVHLPSKYISGITTIPFLLDSQFWVGFFFILLFHCSLPLGIWQKRNH